MVHAKELLRAGCGILDPIMTRHGFRFIEGASGKSSSGGDFACGQYVRDKRGLELHFRYSLGLVTYHLATATVSHHSYMHELLGAAGGNKYPDFSDEPLDGFRNLAFDLENFAADFLSGNGEVLVRAAQKELAHVRAQKKLDQVRWGGDAEKREAARGLFREGKFDDVMRKLRSVTYPELLSASEKKMLEISTKKASFFSKLRGIVKRS